MFSCTTYQNHKISGPSNKTEKLNKPNTDGHDQPLHRNKKLKRTHQYLVKGILRLGCRIPLLCY